MLTPIDFKVSFEAMPSASVLLAPNAPDYTILAVTNSYLQSAFKTKKQLIDKGLFDEFPAAPGDTEFTGKANIDASLQHVIFNKESHTLPMLRYDIADDDGIFEEHYWVTTNKPVLDEQGNLLYIIHTVENITSTIKAQKRELAIKEIEKSHSLLMQAPVAICILLGPELVIELANDPALELWGRSKEIIGKPILEVIPEIKGQGHVEQMRTVQEEGVPSHVYETPVKLYKNGREEITYVNFVYQPYYENDSKKPVGVLAIGTEVNEVVRAKMELNEKELVIKEAADKFKTLLEAMPQITWTNLPSGEVDFFNQRWYDYTGLDFHATKGWGWENVLYPEDLSKTLKVYSEALSTGNIFVMENRLKAHDGTYRWHLSRASPIKNTEGEITLWVGTATDIHEQKMIQQSLQQSDQRFQNLIREASVGIIVMTGDDMIVEVANDAYAELINRVPGDLLGHPLFDIIPEVEAEFRPLLEEVKRTGKPMQMFGRPYSIIHGRVKEGFLNIIYQPYKETDGRISGIMALCQDVTSQILATKKVQESEEKFRLLADSMPQLVWISDPAGNANYFNKAVLNYSGMTEAQLEKEGAWQDIVHPDEREENIRLWIQAVTSGNDFEFSHRFLRHDGEYRWHLSRAIPQRDEHGNIQMWIGASTDIQNLKDLDQQKDNFLSMASHELKTPLTTIKAYGQIAENMLEKKDAQTELAIIKKMGKQVDRLATLIEDLLDITKIHKGKMIYNEEIFDFTELVNEAIDDMQKISTHHVIEFIDGESAKVFGDKDKIGQVINNLISNAIKYSPSANKIVVRSELEVGGIHLSVEDFGIGISPDHQKHVFEQFYRVTEENELTFPGMGIGLYICEEIIKRQGGKIWVDSVKGKGSVFHILLPVFL